MNKDEIIEALKRDVEWLESEYGDLYREYEAFRETVAKGNGEQPVQG